mmetsp:Transcript_21675/g.49586  ORF Transcript_21675/g.49586 Transcript_21675/m.49586 type:complete len:202 (-) Transcript_21675:267-872(-)
MAVLLLRKADSINSGLDLIMDDANLPRTIHITPRHPLLQCRSFELLTHSGLHRGVLVPFIAKRATLRTLRGRDVQVENAIRRGQADIWCSAPLEVESFGRRVRDAGEGVAIAHHVRSSTELVDDHSARFPPVGRKEKVDRLIGQIDLFAQVQVDQHARRRLAVREAHPLDGANRLKMLCKKLALRGLATPIEALEHEEHAS